MSRFTDPVINGYNKGVIEKSALKWGSEIHVNGDRCWFLEASSDTLYVVYVNKKGQFSEDYAKRYPVGLSYSSIASISEVPPALTSLKSQDPEKYQRLELAYEQNISDLTQAGAKSILLSDIESQSFQSIPVLIEFKADAVKRYVVPDWYGVDASNETDTYGVICYVDVPPLLADEMISISSDAELGQTYKQLASTYSFVKHFSLASIDAVQEQDVEAIYALTELPEVGELKAKLAKRAEALMALIAAGATKVEPAMWSRLSTDAGPVLVDVRSTEENERPGYYGIFGTIGQIERWGDHLSSLTITCDEKLKKVYELLSIQVPAALSYTAIEEISVDWSDIKAIYSVANIEAVQRAMMPAEDFPRNEPSAWDMSETLAEADSDSLPNMTGFESAQLGAGHEVWHSSGYLLADRSLQVGEHIHAWAVDARDGSIVKHVPWKVSKENSALEKWPKAFLTTVNAAPADQQDYKWLIAGHLTPGGELQVAEGGSPTTAEFAKLISSQKPDLDRLWVYSSGYRLFTNAPFVANQVVVSRLPDISPVLNESISVQVRDRTSLRLYETYLFKPSIEDDASSTSWGEGLSTHINSKSVDARYGMLRAGVLAKDGITIEPAITGNALWVPQHSNLSVELDSLVWQKYRAVGSFTPAVGQVIQLRLYDRYSAAQLPGSPLHYTVKSTDTDATRCLTSLAKALHNSELGEYLRLGTPRSMEDTPTDAANWVLWHMPLPVKVIVTGVPALTGDYEPSLETLEGKPLNLGELYREFKDGLALVMSDRWSGRVVDSWSYAPAASVSTTKDEAERVAEWVKGLGAVLASSLAMWGSRLALLNAPNLKANDLADQSLWLPTDAECVLSPRHLDAAAAPESKGRPALEQRIIYKRDRLIWEEVQKYGYFTVWTRETDYPAMFSKLLAWGDEVLSARDISETRPRRNFTPTSVKTVTHADFQFKAPSANTPALVASRLSRDDEFCMHYDAWQFQYPSAHVTECLASSKNHMVVQFAPPHYDYLYILIALRLILKARNHQLPGDGDLDRATKRIMQSAQVRTVLEKLKEFEALESGDEKLSLRMASLSLDKAKVDLSEFVTMYKYLHVDSHVDKREVDKFIKRHPHVPRSVYAFSKHPLTQALQAFDHGIFDKLARLPTTDALPSEKTAEAVQVVERWVFDRDSRSFSAKVWATVKGLGKLKAEHELVLTQLLCGEQDPDKYFLHLQLTPAAQKQDIRFIDYTPDFAPDFRRLHERSLQPRSRNGGFRLHIPDGVTITSAEGLCSASFISRSGIIPAYHNNARSEGKLGPVPLTIEMPFKGRMFLPKDSLCADYAGTLGSELYDVSGATENGVDNKTGLFHAHYPVGVIRGLAGDGPELDLTLHYSATRANESALGDGWAFRFSVYDNRLHRLTLHNGQTVTLSAEQINKATGTQRLAINNVTLTGAKGGYGALTGLTVIFPTGRKETLAKPALHDGKEASEHYKQAFVEKVSAVKRNLQQWLKETGLTDEQTSNINSKIEELTKLETEIKRAAYLLVPNSITGARGGMLTLAWEGKEGHVHLQHIADGGIKLLTAEHGTPVAEGEYSSTFTVWPDTDEAYMVKLSIKDCLLIRLTRQGKNDTTPVQSVVFGYEGEPVLDRVLCSVAEEDGSLEAVSYGPMWKDWDSQSQDIIPLSKVLRHTLLPGAGQEPITHIWEWQGSSSLLMKEGTTFSSTCSLETGNYLEGPSTTRTWMLKNGFVVETQVVEKVPGLVRETTTMEYPATFDSTDPVVRFRLATQPVRKTVISEDLRVSTQRAAASNSAAEGSVEESH